MMTEFSDAAIIDIGRRIVSGSGVGNQAARPHESGAPRWQRLSSDGSTRRFFRLPGEHQATFIVAAPAGCSPAELAESRAAFMIGRHLHDQGVPVPELYGWDKPSGTLVFADLGDIRLHDLQLPAEDDPMDFVSLLRSCVDGLLEMQFAGGDGFDGGWCWDGPVYDRQVMITREADYFHQAFWCHYLAEPAVTGIDQEFADIARRAGMADTGYFMHRDFQSRNIMIYQGRPWYIDFQGGRSGPLGYDLASLLIDPYIELSGQLQEELLDYYLQRLKSRKEIEEFAFRREYQLLALQRNLQIIGAFSFLTRVRGKSFFEKYLAPAVSMLNVRLHDPLFTEYGILRKTAARAVRLLNG